MVGQTPAGSAEALRRVARVDLGAEHSLRRLVDRLRQESGAIDPSRPGLRPELQQTVLISLLGSRPLTGPAILESILELPEGERYGRAIARASARRLNVPSRFLDQGRSYSARVGDVLELLADIGCLERPATSRSSRSRRTFALSPASANALREALAGFYGPSAGDGAAPMGTYGGGGGARPSSPRDVTPGASSQGPAGPSGRARPGGAGHRTSRPPFGLSLEGEELVAAAGHVGRSGSPSPRRPGDLRGALMAAMRFGHRSFRIPEFDEIRLLRSVAPVAEALPVRGDRRRLLRRLIDDAVDEEYWRPGHRQPSTVRDEIARTRGELWTAGLYEAAHQPARALDRLRAAELRTTQLVLLALGHLPPRSPQGARSDLHAALSGPVEILREHPAVQAVDRSRWARLLEVPTTAGEEAACRWEAPDRRIHCERALDSLSRLLAQERRASPPASGASPSVPSALEKIERLVDEARALSWDREFDLAEPVIRAALAQLHRRSSGPRTARWHAADGSLLKERAGLEAHRGDLASAAASLRAAQRSLGRAVRQSGSTPSYRQELATVLIRLTEAETPPPHGRRATSRLLTAVRHAAAAHALDPDDWEFRREFSLARRALGRQLLRIGRVPAARRELEAALRILEAGARGPELGADESRRANVHMNLAATSILLSQAHEGEGDRWSARRWAERAVDEARHAVRLSSSANPVILRWEGIALRHLGELRVRQREGRRAGRAFQDAHRSLREAMRVAPREPETPRELDRLRRVRSGSAGRRLRAG